VPFDSPDLNLGDMLVDIRKGKTQLPDFQRDWKWDADRIRGLLASVAVGHPIGVVMMLETGGDGSRFLPRPVSGVDLADGQVPELLILDGQQRLTSFLQSLLSAKPVATQDTRNKRLTRWYYVDMARALAEDPDMEEAIIAVPENRLMTKYGFGGEVVADYSSTEKECAAEMFPMNIVYKPGAIDQWMVTYLRMDEANMPERLARWSRFNEAVLKLVQSYTVPVIILKKQTPKEAVCTVFEKVNTGGVPLNVFELLTATYAADGFRLNDDWKQRKERLNAQPVLRGVQNTDFLQAVTLLATRAKRNGAISSGIDPAQASGISCKRKDILNLTLEDYKRWADPVTKGFEWAVAFLADERIFRARDLPYNTQLVPLAAIHVALGAEAEMYGTTEKLRQWYWCGVLGELYGAATETRFARDLGEVTAWVKGGPVPSTLEEAIFNPSRLLTLKTRNSAAYKGVYALLMRDGCRDWLYDKAIDLAWFFDHRLDIHHIFPKSWCQKNHIDPGKRESVVNKTAISFSTNRMIGGVAPSKYLPRLETKGSMTQEKLDSILATHSISPAHLRADAFDAFFAERQSALLQLISQAMGKEVFAGVEGEHPEDFESEEALDAEEFPAVDEATDGLGS
jgi:hypothetical protein